MDRLAHSYELDAHKRQDLLQNIHLNLWRSFERFNGQCSLRTWVYRVAHNVAATHVIDERRRRSQALVGLEELDIRDIGVAPDADRGVLLSRLMELIQRLRPLDRELVILSLPRRFGRSGDRRGGGHLRRQRLEQDQPHQDTPEPSRE